ncbi:MAG TPA: thiamine phosphate synthase [Sphingomicrobium sp.]|nr:thiamine phosphate synthase [Sphingomicrobium sp.]
MQRRQSLPVAWLITDARIGAPLESLARRLPRGSGLILRDGAELTPRLRLIARRRSLALVDERQRGAARVHDPREIRRERLAGRRLLLLSPLFETRSHPDWRPLPRMRAAALTRLAGRPLLALGGMDARRFRSVRKLGFDGWAAIDAWLRLRT